MTADDYERQIEACQDALVLYPADLVELVAYVSAKDAVTGSVSLRSPIFGGPDEQ